MSTNRSRSTAFFLFLILGLTGFLAGCGGGSKGSGSGKPPVPVIQNLNSSTSPSSPISLPIEIIGTGFQNSLGTVIFTQGAITATVTPSPGGWSDTGIVAVVPTGNGTTNFTVPGTVSVSVETSGGTSNAVDLALIPTFQFSVNNITWTNSNLNPVTVPALPAPMSGMGAVAVPGSPASTAYVVLAGGYNGTSNLKSVLSNSINSDGTLANTWNTISAQALPSPRAFAGMVEADPGNSLVATDKRYIYVIGGQQIYTATPGGTNTVFMATVDPTDGQVGTWTPLASTLPVSLVGPGVTVYDGEIYVVGGLQTSGIPSSAVYSAPINSDGTLGTWTKSPNSYPVPVAFPTVLGFAGNLYVINGDSQNESSPNVADNGGITDVDVAPVNFGAVGTWVSSPSSTVKNRSKQVTWLEFGQIIDAEGVYDGGTTNSLELERTTVQSDGSLAAWAGVTAANAAAGAQVYNAAAIVSPLLTSNNVPRFLLFGGEKFTSPGGTYPLNALTSTVYVNKNTTP